MGIFISTNKKFGFAWIKEDKFMIVNLGFFSVALVNNWDCIRDIADVICIHIDEQQENAEEAKQ